MYMPRIFALMTYAIIGFSYLWLIHSTNNWIFVLFLPIFFFGIVPIIDLCIGDRNLDGEAEAEDPVYDLFLYLQVPVHFGLFIGAVWIASTGPLPVAAKIGMVASIGLLNGQCALIAHEFGHKLGRTKRIAAQVTLAVIGMGHFLVEHLRGHHVHVATPEDCASARLGESIYHFALRDLPGEVTGGLRREAERLHALGLPAWSVSNVILQSYALSLAVAAILWGAWGWQALGWIALHHVAAWFTLTLVTYLEHYGLLREQLANGRYEPARTIHSWNTNSAISNLLLLNVQRHSDHHAHPMTPYQALQDDRMAPRLPTGYYGMIVLALIPPLWFRSMDRRAIAAMAGKTTRLNLGPEPSRRIYGLIGEFNNGQEGNRPPNYMN